jgi:hypothetical protein
MDLFSRTTEFYVLALTAGTFLAMAAAVVSDAIIDRKVLSIRRR